MSQANIPTVLLEEPREVSAINGNLLVRVRENSHDLSSVSDAFWKSSGDSAVVHDFFSSVPGGSGSAMAEKT